MTTQRPDIRQHILDTAKPIILGKGFSGVGLTEILTTAEVPKGSFYHYFKSKEAFGEALLAEYFSAYLLQIDALLLQPKSQPNLSAEKRLMSYWSHWLMSQSDSTLPCQCLAVKLGAEVTDLSEPMRLALQQGTDQVIQKLANCIAEGIIDGSFPSTIDAAHCAQILYAMWLGASLLTKMRKNTSALEAAMVATRSILQLAPS